MTSYCVHLNELAENVLKITILLAFDRNQYAIDRLIKSNNKCQGTLKMTR
jgi:hypothetical protein